MKQLFLILGTLVLLLGTSYGQGAAPAPPSPFTRSGSTISNPNPTPYITFRLGLASDTSTIFMSRFGSLRLFYPYDEGWWLGASGNEWNRGYFDSLYITTNGHIRIAGQNYSSLAGVGLSNVGGALTVNLTDLIPTAWVIDQTLTKDDIDTTTSLTMASVFKYDAAVSDSELVSRMELNTMLGGLPFTDLVGDTTVYNDYIIAWDSANHTWYVRPDASIAGAGDQISYDIGAGAVSLVDPTFDGNISVTGNTVTILGGNGRFGTAVDTTFNALMADIDSLGIIDVDSVKVDHKIIFRNAELLYPSIDSVYAINGRTNSSLRISPNGIGSLMLGLGSTGGVVFHEGSEETFDIDNNAITGNGTSTISGLASLTTTAATIGGQVLDGTEDIINETELNTALAAKVSTVNENWQDVTFGTSAGVRHTANGVAIDVGATINNSDTAYFSTSLGSLVLQSGTTSNDAVILRGPSGGVTSFGSTVTHLGQNIDSVNTVDADYLYADVALRLAATATGSFYSEFKASPSQTQNYSYTWPNGYGTNGYVLSTNGAGGLSWTAGGAAGSGVPIYVNDGSTEYSPDEPLLTEGSGISLTVSLNGGAGGKDQVAIAASGLTESNFAAETGITTEAEFATMLTADHVLRDEWSNRQSSTNYADFIGSDSVWLLDTEGGKALTIRTTHNGPDTTSILQESGDGLIVGVGGSNSVTLLDADTTRLKSTATLKFTGSAYDVKAANWDSVWSALAGFYTLSAGAGDISAVGSMTGGDAFAGSGADGDWLGLGATAGRVAFSANGAGTADDEVEVPTGILSLGSPTVTGRGGIQMGSNTAADYGIDIYQNDSVYETSIRMIGQKKNDGTGGDDILIGFGYQNADAEGLANWSIGVDASDTSKFKLAYAQNALNTTTDIFTVDTFLNMTFTEAPYIQSDGLLTADSQVATMGFVKKRLPYVQVARDIIWNYPTVAADTSQHVTFPYTSVNDTTVLAKCSTTVGNDTLFGLIIPFYISDSVTVDSLVLFTAMSSATANNAKIDSIHMTYEPVAAITVTALTSYATDIGGSTSLTRTVVPLSRTALPGDIIRVRPAVALTAADATCIIYKALIHGSKRS